ncbi:MAG TPA: hypothetical protein VFA60_13645 [Terriglobales bacterium]|nr:hypothetical protein [Terriglobales bacterium]
MLTLLALFLLMQTPGAAAPPARTGAYLYKTSLIQAAPGKIVELIDVLKAKAAADVAAGEEAPLWMRHRQGDKWDLLVLTPMGSYTEYYKAERVARRAAAARTSGTGEKIPPLIAWQEDVFVSGPPPADVRKACEGAGLFHVEMFQALSGKRGELLREREMENAFLAKLEQPQNLIFVRDQGAAWDVFTIGCFRSLAQYASADDRPVEQQDAAARAAGFSGLAGIGPYLRQFIAMHHDTLASAIR